MQHIITKLSYRYSVVKVLITAIDRKLTLLYFSFAAVSRRICKKMKTALGLATPFQTDQIRPRESNPHPNALAGPIPL